MNRTPLFALAFALMAAAAAAVPSSLPPFGPGSPPELELRAAREAIERTDWPAAEKILRRLDAAEPETPEVLSLLGFALRKQGRLGAAEAAYMMALSLEPEHRGALEYYGELRLQRGDIAGAERLLARLVDVCLYGCAERDDLARAIREARAAADPESDP
ncbi:tetratricopeptide repeat protein [Rubrimonas cliftonensis]|uniref:Tetratricopeptide repeat-containing protein n=1 Tax=Rubrimonas cliftonensis TaxID=89524 RepID=A0A1H3VZ42_9RHOB|nr:tetratricopeptide repeat protein [Rubrimonas cliftonensis]SDZ79318.1 Tetratricopeptide repeat-containing protein [Rubrimonas cliftonensis]